jgi:hypothetical protein
MGREYCSAYFVEEGNRPGEVMARRAHSSMRLFSMGVPVMASLTRARRSRAVWCALVALFFTNWASSSTRAAQSALW